MRQPAFPCLFGLAVLVGGATNGGEYNPTLNIGDRAPAWDNLPGVDGKPHSLKELADRKPIVVVFTCNSCPVAQDYEDRIIQLAKDYEGVVTLVAINVNRIEEDNLEHMRQRAAEKRFPFAYLFDKSQRIARDYGATFTPEFFLLDGDRRIAYMGGMDDNSNADAVKERHLRPAIEAILKGKPAAPAETVARGCRVRYARERK